MKEEKDEINNVLKDTRKDYVKHTLLERDCKNDPFDQFELWFKEAFEKDPAYANAMTLSTVDQNGMPDSRIVLLRNVSYGGFTFFTNYNSSKGNQIRCNPRASILFFWKDLERQLRVQGEIQTLVAEESELYFDSRPFESKVGAWASEQSAEIESREALDARYEKALMNYRNKKVPRPEHWGGYVLVPSCFEFWQGRESRLHDRIKYSLKEENKTVRWVMERLMP